MKEGFKSSGEKLQIFDVNFDVKLRQLFEVIGYAFSGIVIASGKRFSSIKEFSV